MKARARPFAALALVCFVMASLGRSALAQTSATEKAHLDRSGLESVEDQTETLANQMLELSQALRDLDTTKAAGFFSDPSSVSSFPAAAEAAVPELKWFQQHGWRSPSPQTHDVTRQELAHMWDAFLAHFSSIEDVRFSVRKARFDGSGAPGSAGLDFYIIGRDHDGHREWVRGTATIALEPAGGGRWSIERMVVDHIESLVATTDLFSEVSKPAGVSIQVPLLGARNSRPYSFYWHGAAAVDVDLDGDIDLLVTADRRNYLYLNDGTGVFREASAEAGVRHTSHPESAGATAPLFVDIDNDGDSDLFLSMWDEQKLLENRLIPDGKLIFRDISHEAGVDIETNGLTAIAGDVNNDGLPDIYVCGYGRLDHPQTGLSAFYRPANGGRNLLFVNQGDRRFREMAAEYGVDDPRWSQAAVLFDFDADGDQDLYVSNDWADNALYLNEGGRFRDATSGSGLASPGFGMGVSLGDYDNDGDLDIHATYMTSVAGSRILGRVGAISSLQDHNDVLGQMMIGDRLYENLGHGEFRDVTDSAGPFPGGWAWGGGFLDFDNDGWQDIHTPNGLWSGMHTYDTCSVLWRHVVASGEATNPKEEVDAWILRLKPLVQGGYSLSGYERDCLFLNLGTKRYLDISGASGIDSVTDGRAAVYADFDSDGDLDVFLTTIQGPSHLLFRNNVGQDAAWIRVSLIGTRSGRDAFGAIVRVKSSLGVQTKAKLGGEGYLSQHDPRLLFGLAADPHVDWLEVIWPSGLRQRFENLPTGAHMRITEGRPEIETVPDRRAR
ncbi:MAG: CRTAC1 family protein [Planctomycetota bacterium]|nr:CRTAC1 family protein [Planctomycetota bacterium]MCZ6542077.1 CRTAC1 family protein [Planctomycetota bacterium]MCZ6611695.1 CRTAC1 family protein [Planctomycetota bacterium]MCZ6812418.1 CRTAC1 family protein [Planctomycetota bacterium]